MMLKDITTFVPETSRARVAWAWLPLWSIAALVAIFMHGPMPMYSTRTLAVAWEMWNQHSFLVPILNGQPYSDKAPLLFWLIHAGWALGGVNDIWPRVLEVSLGAVGLVLAKRLASRLFTDQPRVSSATPWVLMAFGYGFLFGLQSMYEVLLAACVLAALLQLVPGSGAPRFAAFGLAVGAGLLTKGPVMLLHVAFPVLLGPWWHPWARSHRRHWYVSGAFALLGGIAMLLLWALTAASLGGPAYREQLLFHQTAGRVVQAFAHAKPFWWYLPVLALLLVPFSLWPRPWLGLLRLRETTQPGPRFLVAWLAPTLLAFSLVSGKQPYYLLPEFAGFAMVIAFGAWQAQSREGWRDQSRWLGPWPLACLLGACGLSLIALPWALSHGKIVSPSLARIDPYAPTFGCVLLFLAGLLWSGRGELRRVAVAGLLAAVTANALFVLGWWPAYDLTVVSKLLGNAQRSGHAIANLEFYNGQFTFLGRLTQPVAELHGGQSITRWAQANPTGLIVGYPDTLTAAVRSQSLFVQPFRGVWLVVWPARAFLHPDEAALPAVYRRHG